MTVIEQIWLPQRENYTAIQSQPYYDIILSFYQVIHAPSLPPRNPPAGVGASDATISDGWSNQTPNYSDYRNGITKKTSKAFEKRLKSALRDENLP